MPPGPEYPPNDPSDLITLWQGIAGGNGFFAQALATALEDLGCPIDSAICLYVLNSP